MSFALSLGRALVTFAAEALAPTTCAACDAPVPPAFLFCIPCALTVERLEGDAACLAPFVYGGAVGSALARLKYAGRPDLAPRLGRVLAEWLVRGPALTVDVVVPVPIHPARLATRGFDQASLLASPVARALGLERDVRALVRVRDTATQVGLRREARLANLALAFSVPDPARVAHKRVLLVDDVVTTGATAHACAATLVAAGALSVVTAAVAARAGGPVVGGAPP